VAYGKNFCGDCGAPLPLLCKACGSENPPGKKYCADCGAALTARSSDQHGTAAPAHRQPEAEFRQLTVMFIDLVGSTKLGNRLDPEDLRKVITAYQECITSVVARFDGFVARYMGDGALVYFGFPQAHEDDAERSVYAGLAITEAVRNLRTVKDAGTLECRVGIATGPVIVGDVIGFGSSLEVPVVGDTPNLAAGLVAAADPGMVVISGTTRRLTGQLFDYKIVGPRQLKGSPEPIYAWAVLAESPIDSRFEALRTGTLPLVDRTEELALLLRRWDQAKAGEGCIVLLTGEPGIGKSRLVAALEQRIRPASRERIRFICSPNHQDSPLYPIIRQIERAAQFERGDPPAVKLQKLTRLLRADIAADPDVAIIADLLAIPLAEKDLPDNYARQRGKLFTLAALVRQFEKLGRQGPLLVLFEDIHWADPTTMDLVDLLVEAVPKLPMMLVITSRPETQPSWVGRSQVTVQVLGGLPHQEAVSLIKAVAGERIQQQDLLDRIITRADGIPLYIEELTKTVLDVPHDQHYLAEPLSPSVVPTALQASLMARLDRLVAAKEVAQLGSVIGREFSFELLQGLSSLAPDDLTDALAELVQTGLVTTHGQPPQATYTFKHALVQDAAYASLLRERRRTIHARLAELMESQPPSEGVLPEVIAWHYAEAGEAAKAIDYYLKAAQRTTGRFALTERVSHLRKGLRQIEHLPDTADTARRELRLQVALYQTLVDEQGSGSDDVRSSVERARALCLKLDDVHELIRVQDGLFNYHFSHSQPDILLQHAGEMFELGNRTDNPQALIMARKMSGFANLLKGRFEAACDDMRLLVESYDEVRDGHDALAVRDPKVGAYTVLGICLTALGRIDAGTATSLDAVRYADRLNHEVSQIVALRRACVQHIMKHDASTVLTLSERLLGLATKFETFKGARDGTIFNCWAHLQQRYDPVLLERMRDCIQQFDATQYWALLPFFMTCASEIMAKYGDLAGATAMIDRAAELVQLTGEQWSQPEVTRLRARFSVRDPASKISLLEASLDKARQQNAKLWELRAATDLANVWLEQGDREAAGITLAPVLADLTEGLDSRDALAAQATLAQAGTDPVVGTGRPIPDNSGTRFIKP
jgi:class 3 adenylate cyclase/energy-coupling factor transporter ATP-binding protein EcfA2